jgi:hypothetical protein
MWSRVKRECGWACLVGALGLLSGCGKSTSDSAGAVPQSELVTRVADIVCEGRGQCCRNGGVSFDVEYCKQSLAAELEDDLMDQGVNVVYDPEAAGECLEVAAAKAECGRLEDDDAAPACERVFQGTLALGAACSSSRECRAAEGQSVTCSSPDGVAPEVCRLLKTSSARGKLGDACNTTCSSNSCDGVAVPEPAPAPGAPSVEPTPLLVCYRVDGLYCDFDSGACAKLVPQGGACSSYDACAEGSFCDFSTHTCSTPRSDGSACNGDYECRSGNCHYGADGSSYCVAKGTLSTDECTLSDGDAPESSTSP